jgi:IS605 OrfB family transposase
MKRKYQRKKSRKKARKSRINFMKQCVYNHSKKVPLNELFSINGKYDIDTHSFYDHKVFTFDKNNTRYDFIKNDENQEKIIKCKKLILLPTKEQKIILLEAMEAYRIMYNRTLRYIKQQRMRGEKVSLSFKTLRTYCLKDVKNDLMSKYRIYSHTLDGAIKLACASYKSCLTNLRNKNIKHFRIRYLKQNKDSYVMDIEKYYFKNNCFFQKYIFDEIKNNEDFDYSTIECDSKIHYNRNKDRFTLLIPINLDKINGEKEDYISIDPGLRTFLTCLSNDKYSEIGTNVKNELEKLHRRIDSYNNHKNRIKKRYQRLLRERIKNKVTDMHWKIINHLVKYNNVLIGNWSTKGIVNKKTSVLRKMDKRVSMSISYYQFLQRLKYKCHLHNVNLILVDECYTSKTCSNCGYLNNKLGGNKTYDCPSCEMKLDRDLNSCRNMMMKCMN